MSRLPCLLSILSQWNYRLQKPRSFNQSPFIHASSLISLPTVSQVITHSTTRADRPITGDKTQPVVLLWLSRSETILPPLIGSHCSSTDIVAAPHEGVNDLWWNSIALRYLHSESLCTMSTTFLAVDDIIQMFSDIKSSSAICLRVAVCTAARLLCNYTCV